MSNTTHIPNFKKIGSKLRPWQCSRVSGKYGSCDVINYVNELKLKRTQLDIWETICGKFHWNQPSSFGVLARTDTHTHTHRDTQTERQPGIFHMTTCIPICKKIRKRLCLGQYNCFFHQNVGNDVINYANEAKHKRAPKTWSLKVIVCERFHFNQLNRFCQGQFKQER